MMGTYLGHCQIRNSEGRKKKMMPGKKGSRNRVSPLRRGHFIYNVVFGDLKNTIEP
jgi:hypothetical protein